MACHGRFLYKIPNKGPLKITPLQNPGSLQNPKQGSLKCTLKKYPLKPLQNQEETRGGI